MVEVDGAGKGVGKRDRQRKEGRKDGREDGREEGREETETINVGIYRLFFRMYSWEKYSPPSSDIF